MTDDAIKKSVTRDDGPRGDMRMTTDVHIGVNVSRCTLHAVRWVQDRLPSPLMTHAHTELMLT